MGSDTFILDLWERHPMTVLLASLWTSLEEAAQSHPATIYGPLINMGAVGVCLIALAIWFKIKDARYEQRIDERIKRETEFNEKYILLVEKQHSITEKFTATLDIIVTLLKQQQSKA